MNRARLLIISLIIISGCNEKAGRNISTEEALAIYGKNIADNSFMVFIESRDNPLKWYDSIPEKRIEEALNPGISEMTASPGEFFVFQLGAWAIKEGINDLQVDFSDMTGGGGKIIQASRMTCFNKGGIDFTGNPFTKTINIPSGRVQSLWMGIDLDSIPKGTYKGSVSLTAGGEKHIVQLSLKVMGDPVPDHGYNEGARLSRLNWLNSTAGIDDEVTKGYLPVSIDNNRISILGRDITISDNGLPASVVTFFDASNQALNETGEYVVKDPFRFVIEKEDGRQVKLIPDKISFTEKSDARVSWKVTSVSEEFNIELSGKMEFDGFVDYKLKLIAKEPIKIKDIRLEIPVAPNMAEYMMGLGHEGGFRIPDWKWKWDVTKNQDMLWVGSVNGGIRIKLKAENYVRPLLNVYYKFGPLNLPASWGNEGKGGVNIVDRGSNVVINAYSGSRVIDEGEILNYNFELLLTPFRLIDRKNKFNDRYYHGGGASTTFKIDSAKKKGANIINIHHAEDIYPFINYPYLDANVPELTKLVSDAHNNEMRMKFYYTTRELTKNLPEFQAFYSLNGEVIFPGPGNESRTVINSDGPNEWLVRNLREKYIPAWYNLIKEGKFKGETDLSVITTPDSRLNNFYVAGLEWMVKNIGIDGVYIDDSALDRFTIQRARKVIDHYRPEGRMDLHSWNHFNEWAGYANCLNMYMDMLPYFDLVWIGEGRDYNRMPDHWLVEVSGIPFGVPGQMLEGGGNPWRGMVYGITNRAGWTKYSPEYLWKFFDEYKFSEREMIGYWEKNCPIHTGNSNLVASVFKGPEDVVVAIGNWSDKNQTFNLRVDWNSLGIDADKCSIIIPGIKEFQNEAIIAPDKPVMIEGGKGILMVLRVEK